MKINIEKKYLYIFLSITILLFSSLYVIAQTFTTPAWDTSKQSHDVLYTNIITSKASTPRVVKVEGDLEITSGSGIKLGGVKQTSWPTGGDVSGGQQCYIHKTTPNLIGDRVLELLCGETYYPYICTNPVGSGTYTDLIHNWCDLTNGGCSITIMDITSPWDGGYDQKQLINYMKEDINGVQSRCNFFKTPGDPMGHFCEGPTAQSDLLIAERRTGDDIRCSFKYGNNIMDNFGSLFSGFYMHLEGGTTEPYETNGCALMICNNG